MAFAARSDGAQCRRRGSLAESSPDDVPPSRLQIGFPAGSGLAARIADAYPSCCARTNPPSSNNLLLSSTVRSATDASGRQTIAQPSEHRIWSGHSLRAAAARAVGVQARKSSSGTTPRPRRRFGSATKLPRADATSGVAQAGAQTLAEPAAAALRTRPGARRWARGRQLKEMAAENNALPDSSEEPREQLRDRVRAVHNDRGRARRRELHRDRARDLACAANC